ncbi:hypothetical protein B566_EDAN015772 [Ephemera danica]|nr:hypothetical protein B566_EDAN015772 [Ephemera danica]
MIVFLCSFIWMSRIFSCGFTCLLYSLKMHKKFLKLTSERTWACNSSTHAATPNNRFLNRKPIIIRIVNYNQSLLDCYKCLSLTFKMHVNKCHKFFSSDFCHHVNKPRIFYTPYYTPHLRSDVNILLVVFLARSISEEFSSGDARYREDDVGAVGGGGNSSGGSGGSGSGGSSASATIKQNKERDERDEEVIKVYDGNNSMRRRLFRVMAVSRTATCSQLLAAALRAFHLLREPSYFYLTDAYAPEENELSDPHPVQALHRKEGKRPAIFLRARDREEGEVRVYPGKLQDVQAEWVTVRVNSNTSIADLTKLAVEALGLSDISSSEDFRMSEVLLDRGVTERVLEEDHKPWLILRQLGHDSIRQMELMRFYLQLRQDPHGPNLALFVGNLPAGLSERTYENLLTDFLGRENKFNSIGPIYYEYGSMVITYEDASKAVRALYILRESVFEEKHLLVMLLPSIEPSMVPSGVTPLLVFVNVKSGGCQGLELISSFRKLLNPYQVFDLDNGGPLPGLYVFRHIKDYRILVCGGDGTIGWVLQCLDNVGQDSQCSSPACAIVPLGTVFCFKNTLRLELMVHTHSVPQLQRSDLYSYLTCRNMEIHTKKWRCNRALLINRSAMSLKSLILSLYFVPPHFYSKKTFYVFLANKLVLIKSIECDGVKSLNFFSHVAKFYLPN